MDFLGLRIEMFENIWSYRELFIRGIWVTLGLTSVGYIGGFRLRINRRDGETIETEVDLLSCKILCRLFPWNSVIGANPIDSYSADPEHIWTFLRLFRVWIVSAYAQQCCL